MIGERKMKKRIETVYDDAFRHGVSKAVTVIFEDGRLVDKALEIIYEDKDTFKATTVLNALYEITKDGRWLAYKTYKNYKEEK